VTGNTVWSHMSSDSSCEMEFH